MSKEQKSILITIIAAVITALIILASGGVVNAAPQKKVIIYHKDGSRETFDNVDYVRPIRSDNIYAYTSIIEMKADGMIHVFYNSEIETIRESGAENT